MNKQKTLISSEEIPSLQKLFILIGAFLLALHGLLNIYGWFTESSELISLYTPNPMVFNAGLMFVLSALAIIFFVFKLKKVAVILNLLVTFFAFLLLMQNILHLDLGLDDIFNHPSIAFNLKHPGKASIQSLIGFIFLGISFFILTFQNNKAWKLWIAGVLPLVVIGIAVVAIFGHLTEIEGAFAWLHFSKLALHTAGGLILYAIIILYMTIFLFIIHFPKLFVIWSSSLVALLILFFILALYIAFWLQQNLNSSNYLGQQSEIIMDLVTDALNENVNRFNRIKDEWEGIENKKPILSLVQKFINSQKDIVALYVYDENNQFKNVIKKDNYKVPRIPEKDIPFTENYRLFLFKNENGKNYLGQDIEFSKGHVISVFDIYPFFNNLLIEKIKKNFGYAFEIDNEIVYSLGSETQEKASSTLSCHFNLGSIPWRLILWTQPNSLIDAPNFFPKLLLLLGVILSTLSGGLFFLFQKLKLQSQQLTLSNNAKSLFLMNVSHEMRTPLHGIIGTASLLMTTELGAKQQRYVQIIQSSGKHLLSLIENLLDVTKIETSDQKLNYEFYHLKALCEETINIVSSKAIEKKLNLELDYLVFEDLKIKLAVKPIRQVLINLLGNAIKFTPKGTIRLIVKLIKNESKNFDVIFEVSDTGVGIPDNKKHLLFGKFSQIENKLSKATSGTGLGLFFSKLLVEKMNGKIWFESALGMGTRFFVQVPTEIHHD